MNTSSFNKHKILSFLAISFGISWAVAGLLYLFQLQSGTIPFVLLVAVFYMTAPGLATLLVSRKNFKSLVRVYGLSLKNLTIKNIAFALLFYVAFLLLALLFVFLLGNILEVEGFGTIGFSEAAINTAIAKNLSATEVPDAQLPPMPVFVVAGLVGSMLAGCTINLPFALGEELGWRGFLLRKTAALGFWKGNVLIGVIWGVWHWPVIWMGHNYPGYPLWGSLLMVLFCISLSLIHSLVRVKTGTVWAPAALHGMINAGAPMTLLFISNNNVMLGSITGVAGIAAGFLLSGLYLLFDKKPVETFRGQKQNVHSNTLICQIS